jgi:hypothetical protein
MAQMVDSRQEELGTDMIVKIAAENTRSPYPFKKVYMLFVAELGMPNVKLYKFGNTIFVIHPSEQKPEFGIFRALNADVAENFIENSKQFTAKALEDGFAGLKVQFSDPAILKLFKMIARDKQAEGNTNMGYAVGKAKNGDYSITLVLDKQRMSAQ